MDMDNNGNKFQVDELMDMCRHVGLDVPKFT